MSNKKDKALTLALEALEYIDRQDNDRDFLSPEECCDLDDAITAIREALAEQPAQQQEPVARSKAHDMIDRFLRNNLNSDDDYAEYSTALDSLYTSPPASKPWVGLTDKEKKEIYRLSVYVEGAISLTEAKLREKNA